MFHSDLVVVIDELWGGVVLKEAVVLPCKEENALCA